MADFLEEKQREIQPRMDELRPSVDEYHRLEAAQRALEGVGQRRRSAAPPAAPPSPRRAAPAAGRLAAPAGAGARAARARAPSEALELVRDQPGITIPEMAEKMGIQQNYLYRVLPGLEQDGLVRKEGRGWHPQEAA